MLGLKRFLALEALPKISASRSIFGVHALSPAVSHRGVLCKAGEARPRLIDIHASAVDVRHPDDDRHRTCDETEAFFALAREALRGQQRVLEAQPLGHIADDDGELTPAAGFMLRERRFAGKLLAVDAEAAQHRQGAEVCRMRIGLMHTLESRGVRRAEARWNKPLQVLAERVLRRTTEQALGGGVEHDNSLTLVDDDDRVHGRLDDTVKRCQSSRDGSFVHLRYPSRSAGISMAIPRQRSSTAVCSAQASDRASVLIMTAVGYTHKMSTCCRFDTPSHRCSS